MIETRVIQKILERQQKGFEKYGVTMFENNLSFQQWLIHTQEELLDAAIYLEKIIMVANDAQWDLERTGDDE